MAGEYDVSGISVPESLEALHDLLDEVRNRQPDVVETDLSMIETAIIEIAGNVIEHGRPTGKVLYSLHLEVEDDRLVGVLTDNGTDIPDLSHFDAHVDAADGAPDLMAESGRGLWLAQAALHELQYARANGQNSWRMVRRRTRVDS